jgi:hypothetical protein
MSRIYFHSQSDGNSEVSGAERAHLAVTVGALAYAMLDVHDPFDPIMRLLAPQSLPNTLSKDDYSRFSNSFATWFKYAICREDGFVLDDCGFVHNSEIALNTVCAIGNDSLKLMARLHAQCEIYCWVAGPHRAWLAGLIDNALEEKIFRRFLRDGFRLGWEDVAAHLRKRDNEPIVCSYSVCEQFPNREVAGWKDDRDGDGWHDLQREDQWSRALAGLPSTLEIHPDTFGSYRFGYGITAMELRARAVQLAEAK